jgi:hypothetical protein
MKKKAPALAYGGLAGASKERKTLLIALIAGRARKGRLNAACMNQKTIRVNRENLTIRQIESSKLKKGIFFRVFKIRASLIKDGVRKRTDSLTFGRGRKNVDKCPFGTCLVVENAKKV